MYSRFDSYNYFFDRYFASSTNVQHSSQPSNCQQDCNELLRYRGTDSHILQLHFGQQLRHCMTSLMHAFFGLFGIGFSFSSKNQRHDLLLDPSIRPKVQHAKVWLKMVPRFHILIQQGTETPCQKPSCLAAIFCAPSPHDVLIIVFSPWCANNKTSLAAMASLRCTNSFTLYYI